MFEINIPWPRIAPNYRQSIRDSVGRAMRRSMDKVVAQATSRTAYPPAKAGYKVVQESGENTLDYTIRNTAPAFWYTQSTSGKWPLWGEGSRLAAWTEATVPNATPYVIARRLHFWQEQDAGEFQSLWNDSVEGMMDDQGRAVESWLRRLFEGGGE